MASEAVKTSDLPQTNTVSGTARLLIVSSSNTYSIPVQDLSGNSSFIKSISTPVSGASLTVPAGAILTDGDYLYVATSNNTLKRVALSSF